jgi:hypothetical protein
MNQIGRLWKRGRNKKEKENAKQELKERSGK